MVDIFVISLAKFENIGKAQCQQVGVYSFPLSGVSCDIMHQSLRTVKTFPPRAEFILREQSDSCAKTPYPRVSFCAAPNHKELVRTQLSVGVGVGESSSGGHSDLRCCLATNVLYSYLKSCLWHDVKGKS